MTDSSAILLVDDNAAKRLAFKAILSPLDLPIIEADSGIAALRCVLAQDFAVILLDVRMPMMDGFETAARIRERQQSEMTPIIFITAFGGDIKRSDHYAEGAVDFIVAPADPDELRAKVMVFANLHRKAAGLAAEARAVQTAGDQLRLLTDSAPIGIFRTDADNRFVYTNPCWSEITGITSEQALGQPRDSIIADERWSVAIADGSVDGSPQRAPDRLFTIQSPSGSRTVRVAATPISDATGQAAGWVGTVADVTAETEAASAASHYRAVVESSHDAIISSDLFGTITGWNGGAHRLFGHTSEEAVGRPMSLLVPSGHPDETPASLERVRSNQLVDDFDTVRERKDGTVVHVALTTSPIFGPLGTIVGASIIARDISDRRKTDRLKDEFLAMVSHELRTPLSSIVAHIELLLDEELTDPARRRKFTEVIDRNSVRLQRLVGDLLFVAQLESAELSLSMADADVGAIAAQAVEAALPRAGQYGIDLSLTVPEGLTVMIGDSGRLGQAIDNLISNAITYSTDGGTVAVRVMATDDEVHIEVEDRGMGIGAEEQHRVFERFFRASAAVDLHLQGVGLGLAIVKRIIDGHDGSITVASELGVGTTFRIVLPAPSAADVDILSAAVPVGSH